MTLIWDDSDKDVNDAATLPLLTADSTVQAYGIRAYFLVYVYMRGHGGNPSCQCTQGPPWSPNTTAM